VREPFGRVVGSIGVIDTNAVSGSPTIVGSTRAV
jgi:hypothetical protein